MSDLKYIPISCLDETLLQPLMEDEERMWMADLDWDYSDPPSSCCIPQAEAFARIRSHRRR